MVSHIKFASGLLFLTFCNIGITAETPAFLVNGHTKETVQLIPNLENGRKIFTTCALCHSPEGWGTKDGHTPQIAGQHASVIIKQLTDIREGNRDNPTMMPFTTPQVMSQQDIADVAAYVEQLKMTPANVTGPGNNLKLGGEIYAKECAKCHGTKGEGDPKEFYPSIQGQNYEYLLRQLLWIQSGKRRNANRNMVKQLQQFTKEEITAVIDYSSRLHPDSSKVAEHGWTNPDFTKDFIFSPRYNQ